MIKSMTGFANQETKTPYGEICVELRSSNHKFQETLLHLPEGFLSLEDRIKKIIESKIKRGRVVCAINIINSSIPDVFVNKRLLKNYMLAIEGIKKQFPVRDQCSIDTLIRLPGVLTLAERRPSKSLIWPKLEIILHKATIVLLNSRKKEGEALYRYLKTIVKTLQQNIELVKSRFKSAIKGKIKYISNNEERSSFLKDADITEEVDRLIYHARNFQKKLIKNTPVGKELDFIAQEMQREANTLAAKSFDVFISSRVVQIKSQIEKLREQVQNIE